MSSLTQQQQIRKQQFETYYQEQKDKLKQNKERRQEIKLQTKDPKELQLVVQKEFREQYDKILNPINLKLIKTDEQIQQLNDDFQNLFQYYVDINYALIAYDKQQYKEQLEQLECTIYNLRLQIIPRQRFRFSKPFPKSIIKEDEKLDHHIQVDNDSIVISSENYQESLTTNGGSVVIKELKDINFNINGYLDTLYLQNLTNTTIQLGDVKGSVWVDKCSNCKFIGNMHQLRIHDTTNTFFTIYVTSNPIIERCQNLVFSKHTDKENNLFDQVQDFNWLKQEKSPNFIIQ